MPSAASSDEAERLPRSTRHWKDAERALRGAPREGGGGRPRGRLYALPRSRNWRSSPPRDGEEEELAEERPRMMKAERIAGDISEASDFLNGNASPVPVIASMVRRLERKSSEAPGLLEETVELLAAPLDQLSDAQMEVEVALRKTEFDPKRTGADRGAAVCAARAASRKYSVPVVGPAGAGRADDRRSRRSRCRRGEARQAGSRPLERDARLPSTPPRALSEERPPCRRGARGAR